MMTPGDSGRTLPYRPEIDGLRALAVTLVVLRHFAVPGFSGGFVGVDVFFVISGFLITGLIRRGVEAGEPNFLAEFYRRRMRRLLPALVLMLAVSLPAAVLLLLPGDLESYGQSLAATAAGLSNIEFWRQSGYFGGQALTKPLLHTWSLGVEEQFYLLFPVLMMLGFRIGARATCLLMLFLAGLSLAFSQWALGGHAGAAFYLLPSRAFELLAGALLSFAPPKSSRGIAPAVAGLSGLALVVLAVAAFDETTAFPGLAALVPCLGAMLLIWAGDAGWVGAVLRTRPFVMLGQSSYSLYLWHWPLLVFAGYYAVDGLSWPARVALIGLSLCLALLSWRFVEQPFRRRRGPIWRDLGIAAAILAGLGAIGVALTLAQGLPQRYPPAILDLLPSPVTPCPRAVASDGICRLGAPGDAPDFIVWGDSHAMALAPAFDRAALSSGRSGRLIASVGCAPLVAVVRLDLPGCVEFNRRALASAQDPKVRQVFLVARWALQAEGSRYGDEGAAGVRLRSPSGVAAEGDNHLAFTQGLEATVARLRASGKQVIFVHSVPEAAVSIPQTLAKARILNRSVRPGPSQADYRARQAFVLTTADALVSRGGIQAVSPGDTLCASGECRVELGGRSLYRDHDHLSVWGALQLTDLISPFLGPATSGRPSSPAVSR